MKKPVVRILLFIVLLGLVIFYFRYMREGFGNLSGAAAMGMTPDQLANMTPDQLANMTKGKATTPALAIDKAALTAPGAGAVAVTNPITALKTAGANIGAAMNKTTSPINEGQTCNKTGSGGTTVNGTPFYCCPDKNSIHRWSKKSC